MADDGVPVQHGYRPRVVLLRRHAICRRQPRQIPEFVPGLLPAQLLPTGVQGPLHRRPVLRRVIVHEITAAAGTAALRHRLAVVHQVAIGGGRVRDQRPMIAVAPGGLPAHVALPTAVLVGHVRHLDLTGADDAADATIAAAVAAAVTTAAAATLDLLVHRIVFVGETARQMHVLAVMTVQLVMPGDAAVAATVHDLGIRVIVRHRGASTADRPGAGVHLAGVIRPASPAGVAERQGVVSPRGVLLLGAAVSGVAGVGLKRNVLRRES